MFSFCRHCKITSHILVNCQHIHLSIIRQLLSFYDQGYFCWRGLICSNVTCVCEVVIFRSDCVTSCARKRYANHLLLAVYGTFHDRKTIPLGHRRKTEFPGNLQVSNVYPVSLITLPTYSSESCWRSSFSCPDLRAVCYDECTVYFSDE